MEESRDARLFNMVGVTLEKFWQEFDTQDVEEVLSDTLLEDDLWMDDLALEDVCDFVNRRLEPEKPLRLQALEGCETVGELHARVEQQLRGGPLRGATRFLTPSVWLAEYCAGVSPLKSGKLQVPEGLESNPEKAMVRLRRTYEAESTAFQLYWKELEQDKRRQALLACAPLPVSEEEQARFPASLLLLPDMTQDKLIHGSTLLDFLIERCTEDYAKLNMADMEHSRNIRDRFDCPEKWKKKVVTLETREVDKLETEKDEARVRDRLNAGAAVSGHMWSLYLARALSKTSLLQTLLDGFRKDRQKRQKPLKKEKVAPNPGKCDQCGTKTNKLSKCGACKKQWYCSRECQSAAWAEHRPNCKKPSFALKLE